MIAEYRDTFQSLSEKVGQFNLDHKTFLIPEMNRIGCQLIAGTFRGFGINAVVMATYKGLDLGLKHTSGKECFPCQITIGDVLYFLKKEEELIGDRFDPNNYIYFMPEATGPCRFGMYNKYQRIVLDSFPDLKDLRIGSLTTGDAYSLEGMVDGQQAKDLRKVAYFSVVVGDILDRLLWRIRPYEKEPGMADQYLETATQIMARTFESRGVKKDFKGILDKLKEIIIGAKAMIDTKIPRKPLIGIVGEIYLRSHVHSNQNIIRTLEKYGAEVVNASISEWVDFTAYEQKQTAKKLLRMALKQLHLRNAGKQLKQFFIYGAQLYYQYFRHGQAYRTAKSLIDLASDHRVSHLEKAILKEDLYSFELGTEACLSIGGIMEYIHEGYDGIVNVYPFTCMPSTITSSVMKPLMNRRKIPFLDAPYDATYQPGREAAIRTFVYQAQQHYNKNGYECSI